MHASMKKDEFPFSVVLKYHREKDVLSFKL